MNNATMQHGYDWTGQDLTGWFATEKFNGCRGYWDGNNLWSRGGICVSIPQEWRQQLPPNIHLDGEVYFGTDGLYKCSTALKYGRFLEGMQFIIFDCPSFKGTYPQRLNWAEKHSGDNNIVRVVKEKVCPNTYTAIEWLQQIQARGGEGLMVRHPELQYTAGRTCYLLKLKHNVEVPYE
jgi:DNA ligase-1